MRLAGLISTIALLLVIACNSTKQLSHHKDGHWLPQDKALLWEIKKPDHQTSYLFGTIHMIYAKDFYWPDGLLSALDDVEVIMYEIDMKAMNDASTLLSMMDRIMMKDGVTLSDLLSKEDYTMVQNHFDEMGLPMVFLNRIKPMFLTIFTGMDMDATDLSSGTIKSYELELNELATSKNIQSGGLETIGYQLGLFDQIPYEDQADLLVASLKQEKEEEDMLASLISIYKSKDLQALHDLTLQDDSGMSDYTDILLYQRNEDWIAKIDSVTSTHPTLFAVGAGHLGGEKGVLSLLHQSGYTVKAIDKIKKK